MRNASVERTGCVCGNGEDPDWREANDEPGDPAECRDRAVENLEERSLLFDTDERQPQEDREQHDRRDDIVRERVERVRRDVEVDEVE